VSGIKRVVHFILIIICLFPIINTLGYSVNNEKIAPLAIEDFKVADGKTSIKLDSPYNEFKYDQPEIKVENNFVGESRKGQCVYKFYMHTYRDFVIYTSNINYNDKNRSIDKYYISQITLKTTRFKTARGIAIGSTVAEVIKSYGNTKKEIEDNQVFLNYKLAELNLSFELDKQNKVQRITLNVN
jgi:hypothetical protein